MTSVSCNHFLTPNAITLGARGATSEFVGDTQPIAEGLTARKKSGLVQLSGGNATPALAPSRAPRSPGEAGEGAVGRGLSLVAGLWGLCPSPRRFSEQPHPRASHLTVQEVVAEREGDLIQAILAGPGRARLERFLPHHSTPSGADTARAQ